MSPCYESMTSDHGACPYADNIPKEACKNQNFRTAIWTGDYLQMTLMSIPVCGEIGMEMHEDTDQIIRIEQGDASVSIGRRCDCMDSTGYLHTGEAVFVPAGTWHNVRNAGKRPLKLSSIYAPPNHPWGTVQARKED